MNKMLKEIFEINEKLLRSNNTLSEIKSIKIANTPKTVVYREDKLTLYHFNRNTAPTIKTPVLVVYALINTWKMMDLQSDRSYIKNLLDNGCDIYLIDWGFPTASDRFVSMDDYIQGYINNCVDFVLKKTGVKNLNIIGICQGGTLSLIYTSLHQQKIKNLITMVTPVDFDTNEGLLFRWSKDMDFDKLVDIHNGLIPGQFLNHGFEMLKPMIKFQKQHSMLNLFDDMEKLMNFIRMEIWINESPDQAGECFRQFMKDCYQNNLLIKDELMVGRQKVSLKNIHCPLMNVYATEDHLVPPSATIPLNNYVSSTDKELFGFKGGHIGVFVGARSQKELAPAVVNWLKNRD